MNMLLFILLVGVCISALASELTQETITISLQPIGVNPYKPITIASIILNRLNLDTELSFYERPTLSEISLEDSSPKIRYVRLGIYDAVNKNWSSSTSITSVETFSKGFSPTFILSINLKGAIIGISVKSHRIDAGQTRDFGPRIRTLQMKNETRPYLNKPIVVKEGKLEEPVPDQSFLQKYWWIILVAMMLIMSAGGDQE